MFLFKLFHATKTHEEYIKREKDCILRIKNAVSKKCCIDKFIDCDDFSVAFSGSKDNMELFLEICMQKKYDGKEFMYASLDDEVSWQEYDFDNLAEFENHIAEYIANRVNRTIRTVVEVKNQNHRVTSYYLNDNGEWICFEDENSNSKWFCLIISELTEPTETIKTYKLEI